MGHLVLVGVDGSDGRSGATTSLPETSVRPTAVAAAAAPIRTQMRPRRAQRQRVWNKRIKQLSIGPSTCHNRFSTFDLSRETCISQESINRAFSKASKEFRLIESRDGTNAEQLAETLLETSRLLALE